MLAIETNRARAFAINIDQPRAIELQDNVNCVGLSRGASHTRTDVAKIVTEFQS